MKLSFWLKSKISSNVEVRSLCPYLCPHLSISSKRMTGFCALALLNPWMILPGILPIYVRLCPFNSLVSYWPPRDILTNSRPMASAIPFAMLVLPTPGGPLKHNILPFTVPRSIPILMNSMILSFTSSMP